ncbi:hypothetical protein BB559_004454 [Furculomyces boomerangus]|uniref:Rab proteins geranylgeranyltransferase component n=1 Tax=Furculomyces boomerangus TaxID=61424 RepID=A0A2T9YEJ9_9FUNG|nr:hypothetical protein BB559_004454 [Furculomyces boomerangus]
MSQEYTFEAFDTIIFGTGITEALISSALSKAKHKVLHLSDKKNYGESKVSFEFVDFIEELIENESEEYENVEITFNPFKISDKESKNLDIKLDSLDVKNETLDTTKCSQKTKQLLDKIINSSINVINFDGVDSIENLEKLTKCSKMYYIENYPVLVKSRSSFVNLLISTNLGQFLEFKGLDGNYIQWDNTCSKVPDSKQAVFSDPFLTLKERLALSKFIKYIENTKLNGFENSLDQEYLNIHNLLEKKFNINGRSLAALAYSICGSSSKKSDVLPSDGCKSILNYVESIGRFGDMAYLYPLYGGSSEFSQVFCRSSAVAGGTFIMDAKTTKIGESDTRYLFEIEGMLKAEAKHLVVSPRYCATILNKAPQKRKTSSHGVYILEGNEGLNANQTMLMCVSQLNNKDLENPVYFLQVPSSSKCCPQNKCLVYAWTVSQNCNSDAYKTIKQSFEQLALSKFIVKTENEDDDTQSDENSYSKDVEREIEVVFSVYYTRLEYKSLEVEVDENIHLPKDEANNFDLDNCIKEANKVLQKINPDIELV